MANLASAKKAIRQTKKRTSRNEKERGKVNAIVKKVLKLIKIGEKKLAEQQLKVAYKEIDKATKNDIFHPNKAARMKSKLAKKINIIKKNVKTAPKST